MVLADLVDLVGADAFIEGFADGQVESEQPHLTAEKIPPLSDKP